MTPIHIDRMTLNLGDLTDEESRALARHLAQGLADARIPPNPCASCGKIRVRATRDPKESLEDLSTRIVVEIVKQLAGPA